MLLALVLACAHKESALTRDTGAAGSADPPASTPTDGPVAKAAPSAHPMPAVLQCRASSILGAATLTPMTAAADAAGARPVAVGTELDVSLWLDLDGGSKVTSRHPRTGRETAFGGPGRARPCVYLEYPEEAWVVEGKFHSVPWEHEIQGALEWVVTPSGALFYATAEVDVTVTENQTIVKVAEGSVSVWTGDQAGPVKPMVPSEEGVVTPEGWIGLDATQAVTLTTKEASREEKAQAGLTRCLAEAKATTSLASLPEAKAAAAQASSKLSMARLRARAACGVADLRVNQLALSPMRETMVATVKRAETEWRASLARPHAVRVP
jgi:hypothetical protein